MWAEIKFRIARDVAELGLFISILIGALLLFLLILAVLWIINFGGG